MAGSNLLSLFLNFFIPLSESKIPASNVKCESAARDELANKLLKVAVASTEYEGLK